MPRFLHVKPKAKPVPIDAFTKGNLSPNNIVSLCSLI